MDAAGLPVPIPDLPECELAHIAGEIGLSEPGGMDVSPLSSLEIKAWCEMMQHDLSPWEFRTLRAMSEDYCAGSKAESAPFEPLACKLALASLNVM